MKRYSPLALLLWFSALFLLAPLDAGAANQWTSIGPYGGKITALVIDQQNPTTLYAGTSGGGLFKSVNGGGIWIPASTGLTGEVKAFVIDLKNPSILYAGITNGRVFKSTNGGLSWNLASSGLTYNVNTIVIDSNKPTTLYAGTGNRGVFKSTDGGGSGVGA